MGSSRQAFLPINRHALRRCA